MPFMTSKFVPDGSRTHLITISTYNNKVPTGSIKNSFYDEAVYFSSLTELLFGIDKILDELDLPKQSATIRSFSAKSGDNTTPSNSAPPGGKLASFNLRVIFRQNAGWQGTLVWLEGEKEASFRSVLEFIYLIDSALTDS